MFEMLNVNFMLIALHEGIEADVLGIIGVYPAWVQNSMPRPPFSYLNLWQKAAFINNCYLDFYFETLMFIFTVS